MGGGHPWEAHSGSASRWLVVRELPHRQEAIKKKLRDLFLSGSWGQEPTPRWAWGSVSTSPLGSQRREGTGGDGHLLQCPPPQRLS